MIRNYIKIAIRNLRSEKLYAFINIAGFAIGIACCLLIAASNLHEWRFDKFHENNDRLFRLVLSQKQADGSDFDNTLFPATFAPAMQAELAGVAHTSGFLTVRPWLIHNNRSFHGTMAEVNPGFLQMFSFPLLAGDAATALNEPHSAVLSRGLVEKIFGTSAGQYSSVLGEVLILPGGEELQISGVLADIPVNSSLQFDFLTPLGDRPRFGGDSNWAGYSTVFVSLHDPGDVSDIAALGNALMKRHLGSLFSQNERLTAVGAIDDVLQLRLQPVTDVYLNDEIISHYNKTGSKVTMVTTSVIAMLILMIACFNFVMLSIGRSSRRAMEVGIRKVLGAQRKQVGTQFWSETVLFSLIALGLGMVLAELFLPTFRTLVGIDFDISYFDGWGMFISIVLMVTAAGIMAGIYPSVVLSSFHPIKVFKGELGLARRGRIIRWLVVLQNGLCVGLLIVTGIMSQQLQFLQNKDLGFDKEQVVVINMPGQDIIPVFKQRIAQIAGIVATGGSDRSFTSGSQSRSVKDTAGNWTSVRLIRIDPGFLNTLDIPLVNGRNFADDRVVDQESIIVNETLVRELGLEDPLGKQLERIQGTIVGVVKDFHIDRLHRTVQPLVLHMNPDYHGIYVLFVKVQSTDLVKTVDALQAVYTELVPSYPFTYAFLDDNLNLQYQGERTARKIVSYSSAFVITIASLGLLGLALLTAHRKTKEIGIRKVLGASLASIVAFLSRDFVKLILLANLIGWPLAYFVSLNWLENFAYRVDVGWWIFALASGLALGISLLTVSIQAVRAALRNPVDSLRYE